MRSLWSNCVVLVCLELFYVTDGLLDIPLGEDDKQLKTDTLLRSLNEYETTIPKVVNEDGHFVSYNIRGSHNTRRKRGADDSKRGAGGSNEGIVSDLSEYRIFYRFTVFGKEFHFDLQLNTDFMSPDFAVEYRGKESVVHASKHVSNCYYIGQSRDPLISTAAMSNCYGLHGVFSTADEDYFVEPLWNHTNQIDRDGHPHVVYKRSALKLPNTQAHCGVQDKQVSIADHWLRRHWQLQTSPWLHQAKSAVVEDPQKEPLIVKLKPRKVYEVPDSKKTMSKKKLDRKAKVDGKPRQRRRREVVMSMPDRTVETLVVVDKQMHEYHKRGDILEPYVLTIMNIVAKLYRDQSIGHSINIVVSKLVILTDDVEGLSISHHADKSLDSFCKWQHKLNQTQDHHHDNAVLMTRLLTRLQESPTASVEVNDLYNSYEFEMKECGAKKIASKRLFIDHIVKVYPNVEKLRTQKSRNSTSTSYSGIIIVPVQANLPSSTVCNIDIVQEIISSHVEDITIVQVNKQFLKCYRETNSKSNGNSVGKTVTFMANGEWQLTISGQPINLEDINIANTYTSDRRGVEIVITAARKVMLCEGVKVTNNVVMTRFHILENWVSAERRGRILRSKLCNRVISFTTLSNTCIKCQKMTMYYPQDVSNDDAPKENNYPSANIESGKDKCASEENIRNIIPGATDEMVELILNQAKNVDKDPRGRRWTEGMITVCLQWYCRNPQSYEHFRESKYLILPSKSTLIQYKNRVTHNIGFEDNIFDWMLQEAKRRQIPEEGYSGGIIIDEMSIQSDIQILKNNDVIELSGFMDVGPEGNINSTLRKGINEKIIGTHALQFVFLGLNGFRFPFAHFISDNVQAMELYLLFWEAVDKLRMYGFKTVYTSLDGAQCNRSFMHIHTNAKKAFTTYCPTHNGQLVFIMDSKHVIKKIRNNVIKSGILKNSTRLLTLPSEDTIQWQMFIDCYKWDRTNALQLHRKLTNDHMFPTNQQKMRNHLAEEVLDSDMLHLMLEYQKSLGGNGSALNGVIDFLRHTAKIVQIFKDMRPIKSPDDSRLEELMTVAKWFDEWTISTMSCSSLSAKNKHKKIMSIQCHEDIQSCIIGFNRLCEILLCRPSKIYITPGLINSDVIENTFNQQRSTYHGANANPNALQYRQALNSIILGQTTVSQKANAGKNRSAAVPYNCELRKPVCKPKRKVEESELSKFKKIKLIRL